MSEQIKTSSKGFKSKSVGFLLLWVGFILCFLIGEYVFKLPQETVGMTCSLLFILGIGLSPFFPSRDQSKKTKEEGEAEYVERLQRSVRAIKRWRDLNQERQPLNPGSFATPIYIMRIHEVLNEVDITQAEDLKQPAEPMLYGNILDKPLTQEELIRQILQGKHQGVAQ